MGLTVTEKEHWKERIARRIDAAIEELQAKEDPGFQQRIADAAQDKAWESLGIHHLYTQLHAVQEQRAALTRQEEQLYREMLQAIGQEPPSHRLSSIPYQVSQAVRQREKVHKKELMEQSPLGQKVLQLEREKEELLDTVWLATSNKQIKELWGRFAEVLAWEPPEMQKDALKIEAVDE